jgi:hypothetical protein
MSEPLLQQQADAIAAALDGAVAAVAAGESIELEGLEQHVAALCTAAAQAAPDQRASIVAALEALMAALDRLAGEMARRQDGAMRRRATDAYGERGP